MSEPDWEIEHWRHAWKGVVQNVYVKFKCACGVQRDGSGAWPHCDSIWKSGCVPVKALELFMQLKLNLNWLKIHCYWREPGTIFERIAWVFVSVISLHFFLLTYCGLGCDTKVQPPTRPVPEPVTPCLDNRQENKLASVINSVIDTGCPRRNGQIFGRVFLMLNYTDITQNTYIQSWTVTEIMAREFWNFDSCYTLIDYQIHIKTGRNMWFL